MTKKQKEVEEYVPGVIEPSFGIGRILYSLLEHSYWVREDDEQKAVLSFKPNVAPIKCLVAPISKHNDLEPAVELVAESLRKVGVAYKLDDSGISIGRRYARYSFFAQCRLFCAAFSFIYFVVVFSSLTLCAYLFLVVFLLDSADELGIPFDICIDFQSAKDNTATIRERDTTRPQIRVPVRVFCSSSS